MGTTDDATTDLMSQEKDWTTDFPFMNMSSLNPHHVDNNMFLHNSSYLNCPSAGPPNNLGRYISMILYTVVCIIGLFGNSLVI